MGDLSGVRLKIRRAEQQLDWLNEQVRGLVEDSDAYGLVGDFESEDDPADFVVRAEARRPIDPMWAVVAAEILHDFRSALNQLAWQLALITTSDPVARTEFPIFLDRRKFRSDKTGGGTWKMANFTKEARAKVKRLQPCHRTDRKTRNSHPLWLLHELNREDKHRLLPLAAWSPWLVSLRLVENGKFAGAFIVLGNAPVEDSAEVMRQPFPRGANVEVEVKDLSVDIAFTRPEVAHGRFVIHTLLRIGEFITGEVLPEFEPMLSANS